jgi:hypothetical protein
MNSNKYRVTTYVDTLEISTPCRDEIEVLNVLSHYLYDSYDILEYQQPTVKENGLTEYPLKKITKAAFIKKVVNNIMNKDK